MKRCKQIFEPSINYVTELKRHSLNPTLAGVELIVLAWSLYHKLEPLEPESRGKNYREFWFTAKRGKPEDWIAFEDYQDEYWDEKDAPTTDDWIKEWQGWFSEEVYWHLLGCREYDGWLTIAIDNNIIVQVSPEEVAPFENEELIRVLGCLCAEAERAVEEIRAETYFPRIEAELPLERRYGLIKRSDLWKTADEWYCFGNAHLDPTEAKELAVLLVSQPEREELGRVESLSSGQYFKLLKGAYIAAGYTNECNSWIDDIPADDGRAWYAHFGDARDHSLLRLSPNSSEEFEAWCKQKEHHLDHNFEIFIGRGCTRVHLNPILDERGWYLSMWGSITWHAADMARAWKYLNDAGLPTYLGDFGRLAKSLCGEDYVLIMPTHTSIDYVRGEYFGQDIITAIHLPEDNRSAINEQVEWQPVELAQLAEDDQK